MNDRFKFRVWGVGYGKYIPENQFVITQDGELRHFPSGLDAPQTSFIIEQCTGLHDKNGKLIYEGDVVKTVTGEIGVVQWIPARCGFLIYFPDNATCLVHETQEIIGNIHDDQFRDVTKLTEAKQCQE